MASSKENPRVVGYKNLLVRPFMRKLLHGLQGRVSGRFVILGRPLLPSILYFTFHTSQD